MLLAGLFVAVRAVAIGWTIGIAGSVLYAKLSPASDRRRTLVLLLAPVLAGCAGPAGLLRSSS